MRLDNFQNGIKHANSRSFRFICVRRFCTCERVGWVENQDDPLVLLILLSSWVHPRRGLNSLDRTCWFNRKHSDATEPREKCVHIFCYRDNGRSTGVLISNPRSAALRHQNDPILPLCPSCHFTSLCPTFAYMTVIIIRWLYRIFNAAFFHVFSYNC